MIFHDRIQLQLRLALLQTQLGSSRLSQKIIFRVCLLGRLSWLIWGEAGEILSQSWQRTCVSPCPPLLQGPLSLRGPFV